MLIKYNHKDVSYLEYTMFETKLTDDIMIMMYYHTYMEIKICTVSMIHTCIHD